MRPDCELPFRLPLTDSFDTIKHEVHKDLLKLHPVSVDFGQLRREFGMDGDRMPSSLAAKQADHFPNHFIHVERGSFRFPLFEQTANSIDDFRSASHVLNNSRYGLAGLFDVRLIAS